MGSCLNGKEKPQSTEVLKGKFENVQGRKSKERGGGFEKERNFVSKGDKLSVVYGRFSLVVPAPAMY